MTYTFSTMRRTARTVGFLLVCAVLLSGCTLFGKTVLRGPESSRPDTGGAPVTATSPVSVAEAEAALKAGQLARAEQLATRLASRKGLSPEDTARASRVLALAASANSHPYLAMTALDRWRLADPKADQAEEWQRAFLASLKQLPQYDAQQRATAAATDAKRPFSVRSAAVLFLAERQWERGETDPALDGLSAMYAQAADKAQKARMEHALYGALNSASALAVATLDDRVTDDNRREYPYAVVRLEALRRKGLYAETRPEAEQGAAVLAQDTALADPALLRSWDRQPAVPQTVAPMEGQKLVLALPLTGPLSAIGKKIQSGALVARDEFAADGHVVSVAFLDTEVPDWLETLEAFPPDATIVGGPLRTDAYVAAQNRGLTSQRVFLTFLQTLGDGGQEGRTAWRFFPSPEDQMSALFGSTSRLGVTHYAILMPDDDPYAARMADLFTAYVRAGGGEVVRRAEYPRDDPASWNRFIGSFLGTTKRSGRKPATPHQAIFLPDSWRNTEQIVPNLFYYLETRQLLLGTSLWEQGLSSPDRVNASYYSLAVFPGAWNKTTPTRAGEALHAAYARAGKGEPDFWAALGYDFIRYAAALNVPVRWTPDKVNSLLSAHSGMVWSMAPISWSPNGKASQKLFLFTPDENGFVPADLNTIEPAFARGWR